MQACKDTDMCQMNLHIEYNSTHNGNQFSMKAC